MIEIGTRIVIRGSDGSEIVLASAPPRVTRQKMIRVTNLEMGRLGAAAIASIQARVSRGIGSQDQPMPPLTPRYRAWKTKIGGSGLRDLRGPGALTYKVQRKGKTAVRHIGKAASSHMLDNITVREATESRVRIDITDTFSRIKARANERRAPWFGLSPSDIRNVYAAARQIFGPTLINVGGALRGARGGVLGSSAIWMDPLGIADQQRAA